MEGLEALVRSFQQYTRDMNSRFHPAETPCQVRASHLARLIRRKGKSAAPFDILLALRSFCLMRAEYAATKTGTLIYSYCQAGASNALQPCTLLSPNNNKKNTWKRARKNPHSLRQGLILSTKGQPSRQRTERVSVRLFFWQQPLQVYFENAETHRLHHEQFFLGWVNLGVRTQRQRGQRGRAVGAGAQACMQGRLRCASDVL